MAISGRKSKEEIFAYVDSLAAAVLSTVSPNGKPHAAIIYFIPDKELNFYFLTKSDTKKSKDLEKNNTAALTIIDPHSPRTIQATGEVTEVEEPEMYQKIIEKISTENAKGNGFYWPPPLYKVQSEGDLVMYKFIPSWLRFADFSEDASEPIFYDVLH